MLFKRFSEIQPPASGIDRARILCERGVDGYLEREIGGNPAHVALTKARN
jgi:hypothetical protein